MVDGDTHPAASLLGAYALNALSPRERGEVEAHVESCAECAGEARGLVEAAAALAEVVAADPPPELRNRVLAAIDREPGQSAARTPAVTESLGLLGRPVMVVIGVVAAACLVAAIVLGVVAARTHDRLSAEQQRLRGVTAVLAAPDARRLTGAVARGGTASVVESRSRGAAVVVTSALAVLPADRTYQLWLIGAAGPRPAGFLRAGAREPVLVSGVGTASVFAMTVEPAGGSRGPTTTPILAIHLP